MSDPDFQSLMERLRRGDPSASEEVFRQLSVLPNSDGYPQLSKDGKIYAAADGNTRVPTLYETATGNKLADFPLPGPRPRLRPLVRQPLPGHRQRQRHRVYLAARG
jgi:hypothetical protein